MKTLTCRELGGPCDQKLSANSWDEMVRTATDHITKNHPDMVKDMEEMNRTNPDTWGNNMKPKWEAAPES